MLRLKTCLFIGLLTLLAPLGTLKAEDVLLTVTKSTGDEVSFTMSQLEAMPVTTFRTSTIWTEGVSEFTGVSLAAFAEQVGGASGSFSAVAINDYAVTIPAADAVEGGALIAYRIDGEVMSPRDKGPLWIVYPYDSNLDYRSETFYARSIWQLNRIQISE